MSSSFWHPIEPIAISALDQARQQLHAAAQIPSLFARSYLPNSTDDQYAALQWHADWQAMSSQPVQKHRLALRLMDLTLIWAKGSEVLATYSLSGRTWNEAQDWLADLLAQVGLDPSQQQRECPYEMPAYPMLQQVPFDGAEKAAMEAQAAYFANAASLFSQQAQEGLSDLLIWPHHFDIARQVALGEGDSARHVGIGFSPGDGEGGLNQPYWYVNRWPVCVVSPGGLTDFPLGGQWYLDNWSGAILTHEQLVKGEAAQQDMVQGFIDHAMEAAITW